MSIADGIHALAQGNDWQAVEYFAAAAEYGIAAGAQAVGAAGGGGGSYGRNPSGPGGGVNSSGQSAGSMPLLAPGRNVTGQPSPVSVVIISGDSASRAALTQALNQHTQYEGGRLVATHGGNRQRL